MCEDDDNMVEPAHACPVCGERNADKLSWLDDERVQCQMCGMVYWPSAPDK
jgi:rubredoxin